MLIPRRDLDFQLFEVLAVQLDGVGHLVEVLSELTDLVLAADRGAGLEVLVGEPAHRVGELEDRTRQHGAHADRHDQGERDDGER